MNEDMSLEESLTLTSSTHSIDESLTQNRRPKCKYGDKCYRRNPEHKADYSHIGDPDYSTIDDREECPYGIKCYRKNPLHKAQFKHSLIYTMSKCGRSKRNTVRAVEVTPTGQDNIFMDSTDEESVDESDYEPSSSDQEDSYDDEDAEDSDYTEHRSDNEKR